MSLNQKLLKEKLDEFAGVEAKILKLTARRNKELDPFIEEHNEKIKPIVERYGATVSPLNAKSAELKKEIEAMLRANTDADGNPKLVTVKSDKATVQVSVSEGARVVDVQKFFALVKDKSGLFWQSLNVVIKHAEKLVGKEKIDEISEKKTTYSMAISLKK